MTPKQKAKELLDKYLCIEETYNVDLFCDECGMTNEAAKYCALILVDETLNVIPYSIMDTHKGEVYFYENDERDYWENVKQEIEKL